MGNSLEGFIESAEPPINGEPVTTKDTERGYMCKISDDKYAAGTGTEPSAVVFAVSSMQGWRATMEDTHILAPSLRVPLTMKSNSPDEVLADHALFCVFDGHGGNFTSDYSSKHFIRVFTSQPEWPKYLQLAHSDKKEVPGLKLLKAALTSAFLEIDSELKNLFKKRIEMYGGTNLAALARSRLGKEPNASVTPDDERDSGNTTRGRPVQRILVDRSGSTAVMVLLTPHHIICCNAGDSRAVLCREGNALPLSFDHKPSNPSELNRVKEAGGFVRFKRVDGDLAVSRGLGDFRFKMNESIECERQKVSNLPDIIVCPRDKERDQFIVLGCDGIWDVMTNQNCADTVNDLLAKGERDLGSLCEKMLDICLERQSKDNMTFCLVSLKSPENP